VADLGTVGAALSSLKSLFAIAKTVSVGEIRTELQAQILDLQERLLALQEEIGSLKDDNRALEERLSLREMEYRDGMYWDGDDGPFCPACVDGSSIRARVAKNSANGFLVCEVCKGSPVGATRPKDW
jgi:regulator of replication initiation timing